LVAAATCLADSAGSVQPEEVEDKSAYARSGYGVTGIKYQEEQSG
jgi:hypothetical protein